MSSRSDLALPGLRPSASTKADSMPTLRISATESSPCESGGRGWGGVRCVGEGWRPDWRKGMPGRGGWGEKSGPGAGPAFPSFHPLTCSSNHAAASGRWGVSLQPVSSTSSPSTGHSPNLLLPSPGDVLTTELQADAAGAALSLRATVPPGAESLAEAPEARPSAAAADSWTEFPCGDASEVGERCASRRPSACSAEAV
eukprot:scaffold36316_cov114-Isochrysis_galbana.AAC.2